MIHSIPGPILILGADGFIGANMFLNLRLLRNDVFALVRDKSCNRLQGSYRDERIFIDLESESDLKSLVRSLSPKAIFNFAAHGAYSHQEDRSRMYDINFRLPRTLCDCLIEVPGCVLIHAGSSSEYGRNSAAPLESAICFPNSHYSVSKLAATTFLNFIGKHEGLPVIVLRIYSAYGPLEEKSRLIPTLIRSLHSGMLPRLVSPNISRDFVHVSDVCEAFLVAAQKLQGDRSLYGEIFNIGTGVKTTISDLVDLVQRIFSSELVPNYGTMARRKWDEENWFSTPQKARDLLGWKYKKSIEKGLRELVESGSFVD